MMKWLIAPAVAGLCVLATPSYAAVNVDLKAMSGGSTVATGSFSYADGSSGVLNYGDLASFTLSILTTGNTYTLSDILPLTDYVHFAYDTSTNSLLNDPNSCGFSGCGYNSILSAVNSFGTYGFFFNPPPGSFGDYASFAPTTYDTLTLSVRQGVPEPATWLMMLVGFGAIGFAMRRVKNPVLRFRPAV